MAKQSLIPDTQKTIDSTDRAEGGWASILENTRLLILIGIGLLAVVGGIYFYLNHRATVNDKAQLELARIRPHYDKGEFQIAINGDTAKTVGGERSHGLRYIVDEWSGTSAGKVAALFLGNAYLSSGEASKAAEPYEIATGADSPLVRAAAHAGLGAVQEEAKKYEDAAKEYESAASEDKIELNTPEYLLGAARNYEQAGKKDQAIELYRRIASQYPNSTTNTYARMALARHNVEL